LVENRGHYTIERFWKEIKKMPEEERIKE